MTLAQALAGSAQAPIQAGLTSFLNPVTLSMTYMANDLMPIVLPPTDAALGAFMQGFMEPTRVRKIFKQHGIDMSVRPNMFKWSRTENGKAKLANGWAGWQGVDWEQVLKAGTYLPSIPEILDLLNRELIDDQLAFHLLLRSTGNQPSMAQAWMERRFEIPGPSDLIRFAVREAFDNDTLTEFGYAAEFPKEIERFMAQQGFGGRTGIPLPINATNNDGTPRFGNATWSDLYWWAHWELPSLTQGYEMLHRLYPDSRYGPSPDIKGGATFTEDHLERLQKAQDIPGFWRDRLEAISYHPLTRVDVRRLYNLNLVSDEEVYHAYRGQGYDDANAQKLLEFTKVDESINKGLHPEKVTKDFVCEHYSIGTITRDKGIELLMASGWDQDQAEAMMVLCELKVKSATIKEQLKVLRLSYIRGYINQVGLLNGFVKLKINPFMMSHYTQRWTTTRDTKVKQLSVMKAAEAFENAIISEKDYEEVLFNLGYDGVGVSRLITLSKSKIVKKQTKAVQQNIKQAVAAQKAQMKAFEKQTKEAQKLTKEKVAIQTKINNKRIRGIVKASTDENIKTWLDEKLIDLWEVYYRLYYKDFSKSDAEKWVRSTFPDIQKGDRDAASKKAQTQYNGEGNPPLY